ncbi:MAG: DUF6476 family protein [Pseudomonadota bacterium]
MDDETPLTGTDARTLRFLKTLVTTLTVTMILGVLAVVALLVIRLNQADAPLVVPDEIALPDGAVVAAVTHGDGWIAVVTEDHRVLFFDASGALFQEVVVERP